MKPIITFIGVGSAPSVVELRLLSSSTWKGTLSPTACQKSASAARAPSAPPAVQPWASATAFIAPALVPLMPSMRMPASSRRSSTPQV